MTAHGAPLHRNKDDDACRCANSRRKILHLEGRRYPLTPGMELVAEINLGRRTALEYILSPVQKTWREAGRER